MTLEEQYLDAYRRVTNALYDIEQAIRDMPAPESESVTWGSVADMQGIAADLETITRYAR